MNNNPRQSDSIQVRYITKDVIQYFCTNCRKTHALSLDKEEHTIEWYRFTCKTCGDAVKTRTVNLRRFLKGHV